MILQTTPSMNNIPKIIHICDKNLKHIEAVSAPKWKALNPGFEIICYDDNRCIDFFKNHFPQGVDIFKYIESGPIKADFWRCCVLNIHGGFYVDADMEPLESIESL